MKRAAVLADPLGVCTVIVEELAPSGTVNARLSGPYTVAEIPVTPPKSTVVASKTKF